MESGRLQSRHSSRSVHRRSAVLERGWLNSIRILCADGARKYQLEGIAHDARATSPSPWSRRIYRLINFQECLQVYLANLLLTSSLVSFLSKHPVLSHIGYVSMLRHSCFALPIKVLLLIDANIESTSVGPCLLYGIRAKSISQLSSVPNPALRNSGILTHEQLMGCTMTLNPWLESHKHRERKSSDPGATNGAHDDMVLITSGPMTPHQAL